MTTTKPTTERGWERRRDGQIVSNGCRCVWRQWHERGQWDSTGCRIHRSGEQTDAKEAK